MTALTSDCGPHCGAKDGYVGHCEGCHRRTCKTGHIIPRGEDMSKSRYSVSATGIRVHRPSCTVVTDAPDYLSFTLLNLPEALKWLSQSPNRKPCMVCKPSLLAVAE